MGQRKSLPTVRDRRGDGWHCLLCRSKPALLDLELRQTVRIQENRSLSKATPLERRNPTARYATRGGYVDQRDVHCRLGFRSAIVEHR